MLLLAIAAIIANAILFLVVIAGSAIGGPLSAISQIFAVLGGALLLAFAAFGLLSAGELPASEALNWRIYYGGFSMLTAASLFFAFWFSAQSRSAD